VAVLATETVSTTSGREGPDVLALIQKGDPAWEQMVPAAVAGIIKAENLFGWRPRQKVSTA
jgi:hypothetical protein